MGKFDSITTANKMMCYYGNERNDRCHHAIASIDRIIENLTKLKYRLDFNKCAEPDERVDLKPFMIPNEAINILRKHLEAIDKCNEVLEALGKVLPDEERSDS